MAPGKKIFMKIMRFTKRLKVKSFACHFTIAFPFGPRTNQLHFIVGINTQKTNADRSFYWPNDFYINAKPPECDTLK